MSATTLDTSPKSRPSSRIRVALVEDDPVQSEEITHLLLRDIHLQWEGTWGSAEEAIHALIRLAPDVALVDIGLPRKSGIELVRTLAPRLPATQFIMLTANAPSDRLFEALAAGASGYLLKRNAATHLVPGIKDMHAGGSRMDPVIARHVVKRFKQSPRRPGRPRSPTAVLAPCEQEILNLLAQGRFYKEISDTLGIGLGVVCAHVGRIYEKLDARNRTEVVRKAASR